MLVAISDSSHPWGLVWRGSCADCARSGLGSSGNPSAVAHRAAATIEPASPVLSDGTKEHFVTLLLFLSLRKALASRGAVDTDSGNDEALPSMHPMDDALFLLEVSHASVSTPLTPTPNLFCLK